MTKLEKAVMEEKILNVLEKQRFADWYGDGGRFDNYLRVDYPEGHPNHITKEMILEDINKMFIPNF